MRIPPSGRICADEDFLNFSKASAGTLPSYMIRDALQRLPQSAPSKFGIIDTVAAFAFVFSISVLSTVAVILCVEP